VPVRRRCLPSRCPARAAGGWSHLPAVALALLLSVLPLTAVEAQCAGQLQGCTNLPPAVHIDAPSVTAQPTIEIRVYASDDGRLHMNSWQTWYAGTLVSTWPAVVDNPNLADQSVVARGSFTLAVGTFEFKVRVCDQAVPVACTESATMITYAPPPPPGPNGTPVVTLAQPNDRRLLDACATCASGTAAYATPAFFANGTAHSTVLRYSTEAANPVGWVEVDVDTRSSNVPAAFGIQLKRGSTALTLMNTNGTSAFVRGDTGVVRLGAMYAITDSAAAGVDSVDVVVTAYYGSLSNPSAIRADTIPNVRILYQNATSSPYGRGWTVVGDARIHRQPGGALVLTDGSGGIAYYPVSACYGAPLTCEYVNPVGSTGKMERKVLSGNDTAFVFTARDGTVSEWSATGLLRHHTDRWGNRLAYVRATTGNPARLDSVSVITAVGSTPIRKTTKFTASGGVLSAITLPDGRTVTFTITSGALVAIADPAPALSLSYAGGRLASLRGRRDSADVHLEYDATSGQLVRSISPEFRTDAGAIARDTTIVRALRQRLLDSNAVVLTGAATARVAVRESAAYLETATATGVTTRVWSHRSGAPRLIRDSIPGRPVETSVVSYDASDRVVYIKPHGLAGTRYEWTGPLLTSVTDVGSGMRTDYAYTTFDQVETVSIAGTQVMRHYYSGSRLAPDSTRSDSAHVTRYWRDARGRLGEVIGPTGATVTTTYESTHANPASVTRWGTTAPASTQTMAYDTSGRAISVTDPLQRVFTTTYDHLNRVTQSVGPLGATTRYVYGDRTGVDSLIDPMGQRYITFSNTIGAVVAQVDPLATVRDSVQYDARGRVVRTRNRRGDVVRVAYDANGRVSSQVATTAVGAADTTTFAYANDHSWMVVQNAESRDSFHMDAAGRPVLATSVRQGRRFDVRYGYDVGAFIDQRIIRRDSAETTIWADTAGVLRDGAFRAFTLQDFAGRQTTMIVDKAGRPTVDTLPTGTYNTRTRKSRTWNNASQLLTETFTGNASPLSRTYGDYDAVDRLGSVARPASGAPIVRLHEYDALGRLKVWRDQQTWEWTEYFEIPWDPYNDCPGCFILDSTTHVVVDTIRAGSYQYDSVANRTGTGITNAPGNRMTAFDGWTIEYDAIGNVTRRSKGTDTLTYSWNALGQLVQVTDNPGTVVTYGYDGLGRRVRKTVNGVSTRYLLDGDQVIAELGADWTPSAKYTYYPGVDRPHAMVRNGTAFYYTQDAPDIIEIDADTHRTHRERDRAGGRERQPRRLVSLHALWGGAAGDERGGGEPVPVQGAGVGRGGAAVLHAGAVLRPAAGAVRERGSDRVGGRDQSDGVRGRGSGELHGPKRPR